ncbi:tripartite tricarboxylate transporter TctB family protein [Phycicoccus sp. CSK15P-2]|uniref:tripartite tricarboxylate transporter TctB family protein n=1 Tax=Phycicoccus sp. CSK15P-2 TaxID=2807627 RepID=UPI00194DE884|nr:tripartite tricarboxylate transporter TctB family protein [Phycicoccus sp. CSK15P-2]
MLLALGVVLGSVSLRGRHGAAPVATPADGGESLDVGRRGAGADGTGEVDAGPDSGVNGDAGASGVLDTPETSEPGVPVGEDRPPVLRARPAVRVAVFVAGLVAHALLANTAGYVVAALVLFVAVAIAFGAPRLLRTVLIGLVLALVVFYAFRLGLGLALPDLGGR